MLWAIFLILLVIYALVVRWKNRKFHKLAAQLPISLRQVPILGHAWHLLGDGEVRMKVVKSVGRELIYDRNGIGSVWLAHRFLVVVANAEDAEVVLKTCLEKDDILLMVRVLLGHGSIFAPVPIWRRRRKILVPTFAQKTLNSFVTTFDLQSAILVEKLQKFADNGDFSILNPISLYEVDTFCENILGVKINAQDDSSHPVPLAFNQFCDLSATRMMKPWLHPDSTFRWTKDHQKYIDSANTMKDFVNKIIELKRKETKEQKESLIPRDDSKLRSSLELMMEEEENNANDLELREEVLVMFLAGTDTTTITTSFTCLLLAQYPDIQEKVYQEIKEVMGDTERPVEPGDLLKLKYLEAVVKEVLRMYPPASIVIRKVEKEVTLPSGVTLVPGVGAVVHIWATNRNPKYWGPDPDVFRPERFLEPLKHPHAFLTFSNGPRNCIGGLYSMIGTKTVLIHLIRKYRILQSSRHVIKPGEELLTSYEITTKHVHNCEIQLKPRN